MSTKINDGFGFYGILTDPFLGYEKVTEVMIEAGIKIIQLRMKNEDASAVLEMAEKLRKIIPSDVIFIINDDPVIARDSGADGVHLGQGDMSFKEARSIVGSNAIIGLSTHNPAQTESACLLNPDYIGVGPVFLTPTKKNPDPVIGLDGMAAMLKKSTVPAVCLGGIDHDNVTSVLKAGAKNICAVRCINGSEDPGKELKQMNETIRRFS